jgi:tetratricopeptide (TPR) repeat protein
VSSEAGAFGKGAEIRGHALGIVGINTAWLCKDKDDRHRLTPGLLLVEKALDQVRDCDVRIVLGHHPLDWLADDHVEPFRALLGQHHAIYLHGHLHISRGRGENGAGRDFLAIQSGACFQARDGEKWINGLLWGEIDLGKEELRLQPRHWNPENRDWPPTAGAFPENLRREGTDWWYFPLPGSKRTLHTPGAEVKVEALRPPEGWQVVDQDFLDQRRKDLEEQEALRFFDGSVPTWRLALSPLIPRRPIVGRLTSWLREQEEGRPRVALLVGPGGEGKSMAFLQTIITLLEEDSSWKVLWRHDESCSLGLEDIRALTAGNRWLIATDDADLIVKDLFAAIKTLPTDGHCDFTFLLTCRDTDWRAADGDSLPWSTYSTFYREELSGLDLEDARQIVHAWGQYGPSGLGQLAGQGEDEAAQRLVKEATRESEVKEGAFFGAMLMVRIGDSLREHMKTLLDRLRGSTIRPGITLLDAFAYIAAMHAEGLAFLSRPVLAQALGLQIRELKPKILGPLGKEAAAVGAGRVLLTRHRTIARCAVEVLSELFYWDLDELYIDLVHAAILASNEQMYVPDLHYWRYELPRHFQSAGREDLALQIGRKIVDADPNNTLTRVNLAKLYREAGASEEAIQLFWEHKSALDRGAWFEWGVAEGEAGNNSLGALLSAFSLTDQASGPPPSNKNAKLALAGLGATFEKLFGAYNNRIFIEALGATAILGLSLPFDAKAHYFEKYQRESRAEGVPEMDLDTAFDRFELAVRTVSELLDPKAPIPPDLPAPEAFTFSGLRRLIGARQDH